MAAAGLSYVATMRRATHRRNDRAGHRVQDGHFGPGAEAFTQPAAQPTNDQAGRRTADRMDAIDGQKTEALPSLALLTRLPTRLRRAIYGSSFTHQWRIPRRIEIAHCACHCYIGNNLHRSSVLSEPACTRLNQTLPRIDATARIVRRGDEPSPFEES